MAKRLDFKDFLTVDYAPGMPDLIKKNAKKRKGDDGAGTNAEYSSRHAPGEDIDTVSEVHVHQYTDLAEYNTKSSKAIVTKDNKPIAIYPDLKSAQNDYHGKDGHAIGMRSASAAMRIKKQNPGIKIVEETEIDEALNPQQRRARARLMKRLKSRIALGRKRAERRFADPERLKVRARKAARKAIFQKLSKNIPKDEMTYQRRQEIEKRLDSPQMKKRIERMAVKMLPKVRKMEIERKRGQQSGN